jgi:cobalt-zinc-cadmium efflux system outer membrane protein
MSQWHSYGRAATAALALAAASCGGVSAERGHDQVGREVRARTGHATGWEKGPPDDARVTAWVAQQTAAGLTRSRAVEIALINNPALQATYEALGVSQADMVQAGLLRNPTFGADLGLPVSNGNLSELRLSLVQDFLDLFVLSSRKEIARDQFEADALGVAHQALEVAAEAEAAFVAALAAEQLLADRRAVVEATRAAADLSARQLEAGNVSALDQSAERAKHEQAKVDLARDEVARLEARERVNRALGLSGKEAATWRAAEELPPLPEKEPTLADLENVAVRQRLDVAMARRRVELLGKAVSLARSTRLFGRLEVGVDMHRDPSGPRVLGPNLIIELPIFDQRQAAIARLEAQQREQQRRLAATTLDARGEVRLAQARLASARTTALHYRDTLLPLRVQILEQSQLHYNGMFIGLFQLLTAKQAEIEARRGALETLRDYWATRAELARAIGGALPLPSSNVKGDRK